MIKNEFTMLKLKQIYCEYSNIIMIFFIYNCDI